MLVLKLDTFVSDVDIASLALADETHELLQGLRQIRDKLENGEDMSILSSEYLEEIQKIDFEHVQISYGKDSSGDLVLFVS